MQITILGSGSSIGVPAIGCKCYTCLSSDSKNKRTRASIFIKWNEFNLLVDTSPDLWTQAVVNKLERVDSVIYTHAHADHVAGIDNLRSFNFLKNGAIDVYGLADTIDYLERSYAYCFIDMATSSWYKPLLVSHKQQHGDILDFAGKEVKLFSLGHGNVETLGLRLDNFAYTTDFRTIPQDTERFLENLDLWVIDCLKYEQSPGHLSFDESMQLIDKYKPKRAVLCHLAHELEYNELSQKIPSFVKVGYDGMIIDV